MEDNRKVFVRKTLKDFLICIDGHILTSFDDIMIIREKRISLHGWRVITICGMVKKGFLKGITIISPYLILLVQFVAIIFPCQGQCHCRGRRGI